jgi:hypothetical protein
MQLAEKLDWKELRRYINKGHIFDIKNKIA